MVTLDKCPILTLDEIHHRHWETASEEKLRTERGPEVSISRDTQVTSCSRDLTCSGLQVDPPEWQSLPLRALGT